MHHGSRVDSRERLTHREAAGIVGTLLFEAHEALLQLIGSLTQELINTIEVIRKSEVTEGRMKFPPSCSLPLRFGVF